MMRIAFIVIASVAFVGGCASQETAESTETDGVSMDSAETESAEMISTTGAPETADATADATATTDAPADAPAATDAPATAPVTAPATTDTTTPATTDAPATAPVTAPAATDAPATAPATTDAPATAPATPTTDAPAATDAPATAPVTPTTDAPATTDATTTTTAPATPTTDAPVTAPATTAAPATAPAPATTDAPTTTPEPATTPAPTPTPAPIPHPEPKPIPTPRFDVEFVGEEIIISIDGRRVAKEHLRRTDSAVEILGTHGQVLQTIPIPQPKEHPPVMIGVRFETPGEALRKQLGSEVAGYSLVIAVMENGPGYLAGMEDFDLVTAIDGKTPANPAAIRARLNTLAPGDVITLTVRRGSNTKDITMQSRAWKHVPIPAQFQLPPVVPAVSAKMPGTPNMPSDTNLRGRPAAAPQQTATP